MAVDLRSLTTGAGIRPKPTDQGDPGFKQCLVVDRRAIPLVVEVTAANPHNSRMLALMLDAIDLLRAGRGAGGDSNARGA